MTNINRLTAVLTAGYSRNDLCHNRTGNLKALGTFDQFTVHDRTVF